MIFLCFYYSAYPIDINTKLETPFSRTQYNNNCSLQIYHTVKSVSLQSVKVDLVLKTILTVILFLSSNPVSHYLVTCCITDTGVSSYAD